MGRRLLSLLAIAPLLLAVSAEAVELQPFLSGLSRPLYLTHSRDGSGRLFVVEQGGVIKVVPPGSTTATVFLDISGRVSPPAGERGLLGLAFHPQYAQNRRFFVYYTRPDGTIVLAEYARSATDPSAASPASERVLLTIPHLRTTDNGGMIEFGRDGLLYVGIGDGGGSFDPDNDAQNLLSLLGKILRIDVNTTRPGLQYGWPDINPYAGTPTGTARPEIWALGLRNPFRFSFDRASGDLFVGDVGQGSFEEIDRIPAGTGGLNMGWRVIEGPLCTGILPGFCGSAGFTLPIGGYQHTGGRCAVIGGYVYRGATGVIPPGTYVFGDSCSGELFTLSGTVAAVLIGTGLSISSFGEDEAGELYVVNLGGTVHRLVAGPSEAARQAFITGFYTSVLDRAPGSGEVEAWADFLRANCHVAGVQAVVREFFGSGEFGARPLSLAGHVTAFYRTLLGRDPDAAELAAWAGVLRQARLELALVGFIPSAEFRSLLPDRTDRAAVETVLRRFYAEILGRAPDAPGLASWVDFVAASGSLETAAARFLGSTELEARPLSLRNYVTVLYRSFLGRPPDPAGLAAWQSVLQAATVMVAGSGFVPAAEFNLAALCR